MLTSLLCACVLAQPVTTVDVDKPQKVSHATIAESSNWEATSTHAQVVALLDQLASSFSVSAPSHLSQWIRATCSQAPPASR